MPGQWTITEHPRIIALDFVTNFIKKETYEVGQVTTDFLHYSKLEFYTFERFLFNKAADLRGFCLYTNDNLVQTVPNLTFSLNDDDVEKDDSDDEHKEQLSTFASLPDKIVSSTFQTLPSSCSRFL